MLQVRKVLSNLSVAYHQQKGSSLQSPSGTWDKAESTILQPHQMECEAFMITVAEKERLQIGTWDSPCLSMEVI